MGKCVTCAHCECSFFTENGATLDDCPKCGRTVEVQPAPAPLPGEVENALAMDELFAQQYAVDIHSMANLREYLISLGATKAILLRHISDLTRRLAEAEGIISRVGPDASDETHCGIDEEPCPTPTLKCHYCQKSIDKDNRAEAAEARVRELEAFKSRVMAWARGNEAVRLLYDNTR